LPEGLNAIADAGLRAAAAFAVAAILAGCAPQSESLAPASAETPYVPNVADSAPAPPGVADYGLPPQADMPIDLPKPPVDPRRAYTLPELVDIAESSNPITKAAWQRARQAALAVGVAESTFLPRLSAQVVGGYQYTAQGNPSVDVSSSALPGVDVSLPGAFGVGSHEISAQATEVVPGVTLQWLLFDFGGRAAAAESARQLSVASDVVFNGAHQKLIFDVASAFYQLTAAHAQVAIATETVANTKFVYAAAQSRAERGIATTIEVAQARQQVAQAEFGFVESQGFERDAYHALLKAMGVAPTLAVKVEDVSRRPLPSAPSLDLDRLVEASLRRRPDAQAAFARLMADKSNVERARSDFLPRIAATGALSQNIGEGSVTDTLTTLTTRTRLDAPNADAFLILSVPIYDGGARDAQLRAAEAQASAAASELAQIQNAGAEEIVVAYDTLRTSLAAFAAASELVTASEVTAGAARDYYDHGLGTLTDATSAQTALLQAELAKAKAHSDALTAAATIAFASGALTNRETLEAR
jgi:outer membrane protein TolC